MDPKAANASPALRAPFAAGDVAMLYDRRKRRYRIVLSAGGSFSTHVGTISHDDIIGRTEGFHLATRKKSRLLVLRPTFQEAVLELPRQSQVIYPKDLGAVLLRADARLEATALGAFLAARLPRRARPRHLRFVRGLPRTSGQKLDRKALAAAGITPDSFRLSRSEAKTSETPRASG